MIQSFNLFPIKKGMAILLSLCCIASTSGLATDLEYFKRPRITVSIPASEAFSKQAVVPALLSRFQEPSYQKKLSASFFRTISFHPRRREGLTREQIGITNLKVSPIGAMSLARVLLKRIARTARRSVYRFAHGFQRHRLSAATNESGRSIMTHFVQKPFQLAVTTRYIGEWTVEIMQGAWHVNRRSEDATWGAPLSSDAQSKFERVLQKALRDYPKSKKFKVVLGEGYGPLGTMDTAKGILYLDSTALEDENLLWLAVDHELFHWTKTDLPEQDAIERTQAFVKNLGAERILLQETIVRIYGEAIWDEASGKVSPKEIVERMEQTKNNLAGIQGRIGYYRHHDGTEWITMDGDVEYPLTRAPRAAAYYNLGNKWTAEGLDVIRELLRSRTLGEHVLLTGEAGVGKDWLALTYGDLMGEEPIVMSLSEETEGQDFVAWRGLKEGLTVWEYSQIVNAYEKGQVIIIDEVTKTRPGARAILNEIMQAPELQLPDGKTVRRGKGFQIIATMNPPNERYHGYDLGEDFEDRFGSILEVKELPTETKIEFLKRNSNNEVPENFIKELVAMQERLNNSGKVWRKMSLRVLERIIEAIEEHPDEDLKNIIDAEYHIGEWEVGKKEVEDEVAHFLHSEWLAAPQLKPVKIPAVPHTGIVHDPLGRILVTTQWMSNGESSASYVMLDPNGEPFGEPAPLPNVASIAFDPLGRALIFTTPVHDRSGLSSPPSAKVTMWYLPLEKNGTPKSEPDVILRNMDRGDGITFDSQGRFMVTCNMYGRPYFWRLGSEGYPKMESVLTGADIPLSSLAFDPVGRGLTAAIYEPTSHSKAAVDETRVFHWSINSHGVAAVPAIKMKIAVQGVNELSHIRIDPKGRCMVAEGFQRTNDSRGALNHGVYFWMLGPDGQPVGEGVRLSGNSTGIIDVEFDPLGRFIIATQREGPAIYWPVRADGSADHGLFLNSHGHTANGGLWFDPLGRGFVSRDAEKTLFYWEIDSSGLPLGEETPIIAVSDPQSTSYMAHPDPLGRGFILIGEEGSFFWRPKPKVPSVKELAVSSARADYTSPESSHGNLASGTVTTRIGSDFDYPGAEYEYAPKATPSGNRILHQLLLGISLKRNILMIGPVGTGKSWLAKAVFRMLRRRVYQQSIHEGTTVRDLTAWPKTMRHPGGDISTEMELSPLARAMLEGRPYIADEINRASVGVLAVLNHVLQYKELVLPQPMMINGQLVDRIKAADGFSMVMTMNPPGGKVEVNDLMADFMDRMFVIDVGSMEEKEEIDWLEKLWGNPDDQVKKELTELVKVAGNSRKLANDGKARAISSRTLERMVNYKKLNGDMSWVEILNMMNGVEGAVNKANQEALKTHWAGKGFETDSRRGPPEIKVSEDGKEATLGRRTWVRKDPTIRSRYFNLPTITQNDEIIDKLARARGAGQHALLVGEAGVGKDWLALAYGELMGEEPVVLSLSEETEGQDFIAWRGLRDGLTVWEYSQIVKAYVEGRIVILDEVTKTRPGARAILNEIMQTSELQLPNGATVKRGDGFQIIATMNEANERYGGYELGEDFEDRFGAILEVKELSTPEKISFLEKTSNNEVPQDFIKELVAMQERLNSSGKVWRKMSLRVLERIIEAIKEHPEEDLKDIIDAEYHIGQWEGGKEEVEGQIAGLAKKEFQDQQEVRTTILRGATQLLRSVDWSADGRHVVAVGNGEALVWTLGDHGQLMTQGRRFGATAFNTSVQWSPRGRQLIIGGLNRAQEWRLDSDDQLESEGRTLEGVNQLISSVQWSPDGKHVVAVGGEGEVVAWGLNAHGHLETEGHSLRSDAEKLWFESANWSPDSKQVVATGGNGQTFVWEMDASGHLETEGRRLVGATSTLNSVLWSPDGRRVLAVGHSGQVLLWDLNAHGHLNDQATMQFAGTNRALFSAAWSPDGQQFVAAGEDGEVLLWHIGDGGSFQRLGQPLTGASQRVESVKWSQDGQKVAAITLGGQALVWELGTDGRLEVQGRSLPGTIQDLHSMQWAPNGRQLVAVGNNGEALVWTFPNRHRPLKKAFSSLVVPSPEQLGNELVSRNLRIEQNTDWDSPGPEYEYAPKATPSGNRILHQLLLGISLKRNILMIGPVGTGKSWFAKAIFRMLRRRVYQQSIHEGTTVRDLTAWPKTMRHPGGDISTELELSSLSQAMLEGRPYIADEINRASVGVLAVLNHVLQYKELVLPQPMMINGQLVDRIKAADGFSMVMTMNPPGGKVEVNDLMADFMDRMFVIDVGSMEEKEEIDWLEKLWGNPDDQVKKELTELVKVAGNSRKLANDGKARAISSRTLERMVNYKKLNGDMSWVEILNTMNGVEGAVNKANQEALKTHWAGKGFETESRRGPPEIKVSEDGKEATLGRRTWVRKDPTIRSRYFNLPTITQNDEIIDKLARARGAGQHALLVGEAGVGKDWLALAYGELMGEEPIVLSLSEETEGQDFISWRGLRNGLTVWEYSQIVKAYVEGRIVILDEVTKTRPGARAILNEIMQAPELQLPDGTTVKRREGFQIIATMNEANERYGGYELGEDFEDRFGAILEVKELARPEKIKFLERAAGDLVDIKFIPELVNMQERINKGGKVWRKMSLRVLERIIEAIKKNPDEDLKDIIEAEYHIGEWEGGEDEVDKAIAELVKKEFRVDSQTGMPWIGPRDYVQGLYPSPDKKTIVSNYDAEGGNETYLWQKIGGGWNRQGIGLRSPKHLSQSINFSTEGSAIIASTISNAENLMLWQRIDEHWNEDAIELKIPFPLENGYAIAPDGESALGYGDEGICVWQKNGNSWDQTPKVLPSPGNIRTAFFSPDGKTVIALSAYRNHPMDFSRQRKEGDGKVYIWTKRSGIWNTVGHKLPGLDKKAAQIIMAPDRSAFITVGRDDPGLFAREEVYLWEFKNNELQRLKLSSHFLSGWPIGSFINYQFTADSQQLIWSSDETQKVRMWQRQHGNWSTVPTELTGQKPKEREFSNFALSPQRDCLIRWSFGHEAWVWFKSGGVWQKNGIRVDSLRPASKLTFSSDGKTLFAIRNNTEMSRQSVVRWQRIGDHWEEKQTFIDTAVSRGDDGTLYLSADEQILFYCNTEDGFYFQRKEGVWDRKPTPIQAIRYPKGVIELSPGRFLLYGAGMAELSINAHGETIVRRAAVERSDAMELPYSLGETLVSKDVRMPMGNDPDFPGLEYDYASKATPSGNQILHKLLLGISLNRNILMIGPVGTGKSWFAKAVFRMLRRRVYQQSIHEGTTVRDLTAWPRTTRRPGGDISTEMELSPLARAMLEGRPYIADEINRASVGVLAVLNHVLQYKELILPQPIMIDGQLTDRIKAADGFSLVMTMNPPGGRVEVNDLMADFMDRMFVIDVDYLPENEEVDLLMKVTNTADAALKTDIETLVHYAHHMRQQAMKKPSFRALERTILALQKYPHLDPIETLGLKLGMALTPLSEFEALSTALRAKGFGTSFKAVWQNVKEVAVSVSPRHLIALAIQLASGGRKESDEPYNPARWWETGKPTLPEQRRARERRDVLEKVMQIVTGLNIPLKAWYPLPGELGSMKTWRAMWNSETMAPMEMNFVAEDMITPSSEESVLGVLYHELFELLYRCPEQSDPAFLNRPGAAILDNAIGDIWINRLGSADFSGAKEWLMTMNRETYASTRINNSLEETQALMNRQPLYLQFGLGMIHEWVFGHPDPTILNPDVKNAIETLRARVQATYTTTNVSEHKRLIEELYQTPEFQALVTKSVEDKAQANAIDLSSMDISFGGGSQSGQRIPWETLTDAQRKALQKKIQEAWDKLPDSEKERLRAEASEQLKEQDKGETGKEQPHFVDQNGNPLKPEDLAKAAKAMQDSVEKAKEEMAKYEEEQELRRMEDETEAAQSAKQERDREGLSEAQQTDYEARYQRVQGDVGRMRTVFRKFYQRQMGYWQRWLERGILDDSSLPLAVAGEDRIFKKRKLPKQYKVRVSLLVDQSGSMSGYKIEAAADAALMMLKAIEGDQKKGISLEVVGFYSGEKGVKKPDEIYFAYGEKLTKQKIVKAIADVAATHGGNEDLRAMYKAFGRIPQQEPNTLNLIIHFSDGDPNFQFSRDRFRRWINSKPNMTVVGLGVGPGAELILDLYPKGQGAWAENAHDVPAKLETVLERFIGRHGRNGVAKTTRLSKEDLRAMESQARIRAQKITTEGTILAGISSAIHNANLFHRPNQMDRFRHNIHTSA